jgi:hypothetical protein
LSFLLTLTLLVPGVFTDHPHNTLPTDDLTFVADLLDAGSNLHGIPQSKLGDDLSAILVVAGGTNLNAISHDEPADPMSSNGFKSRYDPAPVRDANRVKGIREHFLHRPYRI